MFFHSPPSLRDTSPRQASGGAFCLHFILALSPWCNAPLRRQADTSPRQASGGAFLFIRQCFLASEWRSFQALPLCKGECPAGEGDEYVWTFRSQTSALTALCTCKQLSQRHYPLIAGNSCYYQRLAATNGDYLLVAANCYLYVLGRMLTSHGDGGDSISMYYSISTNCLFGALHTGQTQSAGKSSKAVLAGMPPLMSPNSGS